MAPSRYAPQVGEKVHLFGESFSFQEHPQAPGIIFSSEGGRAMVYQITSSRGERFGLKVFHKKFRNPDVLDSSQHLKDLKGAPGLRAADRRIVAVSDPAAVANPALQYAVLMPWVPGKTWYDCLSMAEARKLIFQQDQAASLCTVFLDVVGNLESRQYAHTDISPGNVMVDVNNSHAELLDLEEIYYPTRPRPRETTVGTEHYQHRAMTPTWQPAGDRYAAALLASELILTANKELTPLFSDKGFYGGTCDTAIGRERFARAKEYLEVVAPEFLGLLQRAWLSDSLAECPKISELQAGLAKGPRVRVVTPFLPSDPPPPDLPPVSPGVWGTWDSSADVTAPSAKTWAPPPSSAPQPAPVAPSAFWSGQGGSTSPSPAPSPLPSYTPAPSSSSGRHTIWIVVAIAAALLGLTLLLTYFAR